MIEDLNLHIEEGQFATLIGESGCGKTTTLKMLNALISHNSGEILVNGENIKSYELHELRRSIGYVIQSIGLFPNMTVEENIGVVPDLLKWDKKKIQDRTIELMDMVNMPYDQYGKAYPRNLSGGQQQRVGVLRALAADPDIILMDEPFGALDPITRDIMQVEVRNMQKKLKKTILFVTHDMDEAIKMSDVVVFMDQGKIIQKASPKEMLENPANDIVRDFLGAHVTRGKDQDEPLLARDVMRFPVFTKNIFSSLKEALWLMRDESIDRLIIVDDQETYLGILHVDDLEPRSQSNKTIEDLLKTDYQTIDSLEMANKAFEILGDDDHNFIIVLEGLKPVGIITRSLMAKGMAEYIWGKGGQDV